MSVGVMRDESYSWGIYMPIRDFSFCESLLFIMNR